MKYIRCFSNEDVSQYPLKAFPINSNEYTSLNTTGIEKTIIMLKEVSEDLRTYRATCCLTSAIL